MRQMLDVDIDISRLIGLEELMERLLSLSGLGEAPLALTDKLRLLYVPAFRWKPNGDIALSQAAIYSGVYHRPRL
jgi:hypothetical protein